MADNTGSNLRSYDRGEHTEIARDFVTQYIRDHQPLADAGFSVSLVWFCYTLGGWKALVTSSFTDGHYYEVTHNVHKNETYLDVYVKVDNVVMEGPMKS